MEKQGFDVAGDLQFQADVTPRRFNACRERRTTMVERMGMLVLAAVIGVSVLAALGGTRAILSVLLLVTMRGSAPSYPAALIVEDASASGPPSIEEPSVPQARSSIPPPRQP